MPDDAVVLQLLAETPDLSGILRELVDFDVEDLAYAGAFAARLSSGESLQAIAVDGTGGRYFLVGAPTPARRVLYATSEGSAGLVGSSLAGALATMVAVPNWRDLLGFSGGGRLDEMRRARSWLADGEQRWYPDLDELQVALATGLGLVLPDDPVLALWEAVSATDPDVDFIDDDDAEATPWDSLFGVWTIERLTPRSG
ncbi:hypothetical protein AB0H83_50150 [Dactylosporangium sp. NPDC050688]|uniref:hypothetical protein n=1 Tax=Dactylosporangium sp. NPDC050688 TaxID=3157217 RepID=UPI0033E533D6